MLEYSEETLEDLLYTFPKSEYDVRYERAREIMAEKDLDAIMVTDKTNVVYFTGYHKPQYGLDKWRRYAFILPLDGDPTFIIPTIDVPPFPWVPNFIDYQYTTPPKIPFETFVPKLVETISDIGLTGKKIGCEIGRETWLWMTYLEFNELQNKMPDTKFVDGAEVLIDLMAIKSDREVYRIRKAACAAAKGAVRTFEEMMPGMTERDLAKLLRINILKAGGDCLPCGRALFTSSGHTLVRKRPFRIMEEATLRRPQRGEQLHFDISGVRYRYYYCDITRDAFLGYAHPKSKKMWKYMRNVCKTLLNTIEPGLDIKELPRKYLSLAAEIKKKDPELGEYFMRLQRRLEVDGMGHGVGHEPYEFPTIGLWETGQPYKKKVRLEPGMVLAVNPNIRTDNKYGHFNTEENILVTKNGFELLSEPGITDEIPIYWFV